jgi:hypothetical protein
VKPPVNQLFVRRRGWPLARNGRQARRGWAARRAWPLAATAGLAVIGMVTTTWGATLLGKQDWALPDDLWRTLIAAQRLLHGNLNGLYTLPTALVSFPGAAVILVPLAAVIGAAGLSLQMPGPQNAHPAVWLLAGPYEIALAALVLFAADAIAEHLDVSWPKRAVLAAAGAVALWGVTLRFGHPEDAVAVGLFLYGVLALARARARRSGWLIGAAVAVQPLVLLALPLVLAVTERRLRAGFLVRAAAPGALTLGVAAAANWHATVSAVTSQPNSTMINHPTPWTSLAAHLGGGMIAAGPARALAVLAACGCAVAVGRRWVPTVPGTAVPGTDLPGTDLPGTDLPGTAARGTDLPGTEWSTETLARLLWWIAAALALRSVFEPVMVAYYVWPVLAVALIPAARNWPRLAAVAVVAAGETFAAQLPWHDPWRWWLLMITGLSLVLWLARVRPGRPRTSGALMVNPLP